MQRYSDSVQPLFYRITSYWGGLDGSVMFWVFLLSIFGSVAVKVNRESQRELIPYVVGITAMVEMFFLFLMLVHNNPFDTFLTESPVDGAGLNPLLQNFYMAIHPPTMYLGFVGLTIPYAFGMAALITGQLDDSWLRAVRRWTMFSWFFLSLGLTLGMIWAYEELGWGGFWGWDPVENAGALPWFTATAFLHSVMVQERRGMLRVWNVTLVIITFLLTMFQTFMTRSGVVQSVHAFGEDPELGRMFIIFMLTIAVTGFGWVIYRLPMLKARNELESWASREGAFLANNWILLFSAFFILFATMFPTITEAITGERLTVGPPFFNKWMTPVGLMLLGPDGRRPAARLAQDDADQPGAAVPVADACGFVVAGGAMVALGVRVWSSGICFALCGFVFGTIAQEYVRGTNVRQADLRRRLLHRDDRPRRPQQAALRRLHRSSRYRADFPGLRRRGHEPRRAGGAEAQRAGDCRRLHAASRLAARHRRRPEADDHGTHHRDGSRRPRDRQDAPGEMVLPQAREPADERSRHPPFVCRGSLRRDAGLRDQGPVGEPRDPHQSARELGLDGIWCAGHRDRDRAPARNRIRVRGGQAARPAP